MSALTASLHPSNYQENSNNNPIPLDTQLGILINRTIKRLYNDQGFYSALNFIIRAGLVDCSDQAAAENYLNEVINEEIKN